MGSIVDTSIMTTVAGEGAPLHEQHERMPLSSGKFGNMIRNSRIDAQLHFLGIGIQLGFWISLMEIYSDLYLAPMLIIMFYLVFTFFFYDISIPDMEQFYESAMKKNYAFQASSNTSFFFCILYFSLLVCGAIYLKLCWWTRVFVFLIPAISSLAYYYLRIYFVNKLRQEIAVDQKMLDHSSYTNVQPAILAGATPQQL